MSKVKVQESKEARAEGAILDWAGILRSPIRVLSDKATRNRVRTPRVRTRKKRDDS